MKQEVLNFKFKLINKDFFVSEKNKLAFNLINQWPNWSNQMIYIYGPKKCGKTTIAKIWQEKSSALFLNNKNILEIFSENLDVNFITDHNWIIDDINYLFRNNSFDEKILNLINIIQTKKKSNLLITSTKPPKSINSKIKDLISRVASSFVVEVNEPDNDLLCKIIRKYLDERNIKIENKHLDYLSKRIERSYKSALYFARRIDEESLQTHSKITTKFLKNIIN